MTNLEKRAKLWTATLFAGVLIAAATAVAQTTPSKGQSSTTGAVCPLSDEQTQKSIAAFAKVAAAFTGEDRCANCHGGVDAFSENGHHAGGARENPTGSRAPCQDCHSGLPGWDTPPPEMNFMDGYHQPRPAATICKQIKRFMGKGERFVNHIRTNTDFADFNRVAFEGTRGLNDRGQAIAFTDPYRDLPPSISRSEMVKRAQDWVDATGGEFKGDESCGCEPVHYAVRVSYDQNIQMSMVHAEKHMGPIDVPITFHDDGSFDGEQIIFINGSALALQCSSISTTAMSLRVLGQATEDEKTHHLRLQMENGSPLRGAAFAQCPNISRSNAFSAISQGSLEKEIEGRVGEVMLFKPSVGLAGIDTIIVAYIVKAGTP